MPQTMRRASEQHTKPCRLFQAMRCPHTATQCAYAHVYTDRPAPRPARVCRYFMAGFCSNGAWCPFRHPNDDPALLPSDGDADWGFSWAHVLRPKKGEYPQLAPPGIYVAPSPHAFHGLRLAAPAWTPYADTFALPSIPPPSTPSDTYSSSESGSSASDDVIMVLDPPAHAGTPDFAYPGTPDSAYPNMRDFTYPGSPEGYHMMPPAPPPTPELVLDVPSSKMARRIACYKTKPCKFYSADGVCPNGAACTFIHSDALVVRPAVDTRFYPDVVRKNKVAVTPQAAPQIEKRRQSDCPILWRVIGGGVALGSTKRRGSQQSDDFVDGASEARGRSRSRSYTPPTTIEDTVSYDASALAEAESAAETRDCSTPADSRAHARSSSIPPTPTSARMDVASFFPVAESPASL